MPGMFMSPYYRVPHFPSNWLIPHCGGDLVPWETHNQHVCLSLGLGERRGSLDERDRERVRSGDRLVGEWEGTVPGPAPRIDGTTVYQDTRHD
jgi:hypothetical protein